MYDFRGMTINIEKIIVHIIVQEALNSLTLRLLMSHIYIYIYGAPILDVSSAGRSPAEILVSNPTGGMDICLL